MLDEGWSPRMNCGHSRFAGVSVGPPAMLGDVHPRGQQHYGRIRPVGRGSLSARNERRPLDTASGVA